MLGIVDVEVEINPITNTKSVKLQLYLKATEVACKFMQIKCEVWQYGSEGNKLGTCRDADQVWKLGRKSEGYKLKIMSIFWVF